MIRKCTVKALQEGWDALTDELSLTLFISFDIKLCAVSITKYGGLIVANKN